MENLNKIINNLYQNYDAIPKQEINPKWYGVFKNIEHLAKEGHITYEELIEYFQKGLNYIRLRYCIELESLAKDSRLMQNVFAEKTTYEREAERYRDILDISFSKRIKCLFKRKPYKPLVNDLSKLSEFFLRKDYSGPRGYSISLLKNRPHKNLISKAKEIDDQLDTIYFNKKGYFT